MKPLFARLAVASLLSCAASPLLAQASQVDLQLQVLTSTVKLEQPATFRIVLSNPHPSRRVALRGDPGFAAGGGLELVVIDAAGVRRKAPPADELAADETPDDSRAVLLHPGHGLALQRRELASALFPAPGIYRVQVEYRSPLPANAGGGNDIEGAAAVSDLIEIEVTP
jgi:hypothetical protein